MLKFQKIQRFAESWERSLRYGSINHETIPGLINIFLNFNPDLGDESLEMILEVLKEDVWIKKLEMKGCGLTDLGAEQICKCLKMNETLITFEIDKNPDISNTMYKRICVKLGAETSAIDEESTKLSNAQLLYAILLNLKSRIKKYFLGTKLTGWKTILRMKILKKFRRKIYTFNFSIKLLNARKRFQDCKFQMVIH